MYCLLKLCCLCLKEKSHLLNMHNASSVIEKLRRIVNYFGLNSLRTMMICEECCERLQETYEFVTMCVKNSASFQGYVDLMTANNDRGSEGNLVVKLETVNKVKYEIKCEQDENVEYKRYTTEVITEHCKIDEGKIYATKESEQKIECDIKEDNQTVDDLQNVAVKIEDPITDHGSEATEIEDCPIKEEYETEESQHFADQCHSEIIIKDEVMSDIEETMEDKENNSQENAQTITHTGAKLFECLTCNKRFKTKAHLTRHIRIHTGERPYKCSQCHKSFIRKDYLFTHMRLHTGARPYKCKECHECFTAIGNLTRHMQVHTGDRPYKCTECHKCFSIKGNLTRYIRVHTGERPYKCTQCHQCFRMKGDLTRHKRIHTGERPYKCTECDECFAMKCNLTRHKLVHTGERPYNCTDCHEYFKTKGNLNRHKLVHTGERL